MSVKHLAEQELKRDISFIAAMAIVIGMIIGSGIFFKPSIVLQNTGAPGLGLLAWILGGIITLASGLTVAELAAAIPKTGGLYAYLDEIYGNLAGFLLGWVQSLIYYPATMAALAIIFITQLTFYFPLPEFTQKIFAIVVIIFLTFMNWLGARYGGYIQTIATLGKLVPIALIAIFGLVMGRTHDFTPVINPDVTVSTGLGAAILATLWAYDGWISVGNVAGEMRDPARQLPKVIISGIIVVIIIYVSINVAMLNVLPAEQLAKSATPATDVATVIFGPTGASLITLGILVSIFGCLNGYVLTAARVPFAMAERGLFPASNAFSKLHPSAKTPTAALILEAIIVSILIFAGTFNRLTDLAIFALWIFFVMAVGGVFVLRKKVPPEKRPYKTPFYPITPIIGIVGGSYILINNLFTNPLDSLIGIGITLIGIPVYWILTKNKGNISH